MKKFSKTSEKVQNLEMYTDRLGDIIDLIDHLTHKNNIPYFDNELRSEAIQKIARAQRLLIEAEGALDELNNTVTA